MNVSESSDLVIGEVFSTAADNMVAKEGTDLSPTIKCRMCDKCWPQNTKWGRHNLIMYYHSHLISKHFKHLWAKDVPQSSKQAGGEFSCNVANCAHKTSLRFSMLIHLAMKHKQLKLKLAEGGYPADIITPILLTPDFIEKQAESYVSSTTDDNPCRDQDQGKIMCAVCKTYPDVPLHDHVYNHHGFNLDDYLEIKNRLGKTDKIPDPPLLEDTIVKVEHNPFDQEEAQERIPLDLRTTGPSEPPKRVCSESEISAMKLAPGKRKISKSAAEHAPVHRDESTETPHPHPSILKEKMRILEKQHHKINLPSLKTAIVKVGHKVLVHLQICNAEIVCYAYLSSLRITVVSNLFLITDGIRCITT